MSKLAPEHRTADASCRLRGKRVKADGGSPQGLSTSAHQRKSGVTGMQEVVGDREVLETAEARVLAWNFKNKETLAMQLKKLERLYGAGAGERIKGYMRTVWKLEMLK